MKPSTSFSVPLALLGLAIGACAPTAQTPEIAPRTRTAQAPAPAVSDAQIAGIVVAANAIDVEVGRLALAKSQNPEVRRFAQLMITDHTAVNASAAALVQRLGVTPADSPVKSSLQSSAAETQARLGALQGSAFDQAYLDNEIAYHQAVINAVDAVLIPSAQNSDLKAALVSTRPAFQAHLEHARHARASLSGTAGR